MGDVPRSGAVLRHATTQPVIVARFDDEPSPSAGGAPRAQPDFSAVQPPLSMRVTVAPVERARPVSFLREPQATQETVTLQDASGQHTFTADRQTLDSHYSACRGGWCCKGRDGEGGWAARAPTPPWPQRRHRLGAAWSVAAASSPTRLPNPAMPHRTAPPTRSRPRPPPHPRPPLQL